MYFIPHKTFNQERQPLFIYMDSICFFEKHAWKNLEMVDYWTLIYCMTIINTGF